MLNGDANGVPDADGRVLIGQFTTDGVLSGNVQVQLFPQGDNENFLLLDLPIGLGVGCPSNGNDNCLYDDAIGVCGGDCTADADADGLCDDDDDCIGQLDECGVCNGPGAVLDCGCDPIADGAWIVTATSSTPSACAVAIVRPMPMPTASATTKTTASARSMNAASATAPAPWATAVAMTSRMAIATATATSSTPWACGGDCTADADQRHL